MPTRVRDLIKQGVNVNYQDMVSGAARKRREPLRERPPPPRPLPALSQNGATPLWMSAVYGRAEIVRILLDADADPNLHTNHAKTPLYEAADNGYTDIVRMLIDKGANRHIPEKNGRLPIDAETAAIRTMLKDASRMNLQLARHDKSVQREAFPEIAEDTERPLKTLAGTARYLKHLFYLCIWKCATSCHCSARTWLWLVYKDALQSLGPVTRAHGMRAI